MTPKTMLTPVAIKRTRGEREEQTWRVTWHDTSHTSATSKQKATIDPKDFPWQPLLYMETIGWSGIWGVSQTLLSKPSSATIDNGLGDLRIIDRN